MSPQGVTVLSVYVYISMYFFSKGEDKPGRVWICGNIKGGVR